MNLQDLIKQEKQKEDTTVYESLVKIEVFIEELKRTNPDQAQVCSNIFNFDATEFEAMKDFFDQTNFYFLGLDEKNILLLFAVYARKEELVKFLINEIKINPNFITYPGFSPLLVATPSIRKLLLELGATRNRLLLTEAKRFGGEKFWSQQASIGKYQGGFLNWINFLLEEESLIKQMDFLEYSIFDNICEGYHFYKKMEIISEAHSHILIKFIELDIPQITGKENFVRRLLLYKEIFIRNAKINSSIRNYNEAVKKAIVNWALAQQEMTAPLKALINFFINELEDESVIEIVSAKKSNGILYENIQNIRELIETLDVENIKASCQTFFESILKNFKYYTIFFCEEIPEAKNLLLLLATYQGNSELVKFLIISLSANPNLITDYGICPLLVATSTEMRSLLLEYGANVLSEKPENNLLVRECREWNGYHFWFEQRLREPEQSFSEWFNFLIKHTPIIAIDHSDNTAMHYILTQYYTSHWHDNLRHRLEDPPAHLHRPTIEKIQELLTALITAGALANEKDAQAMGNYVFDREKFFPYDATYQTSQFTLAPQIATAIVDWIKSQKSVTLPQKRLAILYSTALPGKIIKVMCRLVCAEEKAYIEKLRQQQYAPQKVSSYEFPNDISPEYIPIFQAIENLFKNTAKCIELFGELEQKLKNKCDEAKIIIPPDDPDYFVLNYPWAIPTTPYENNTKGILNSSFLAKEIKFGINEDLRSPAYFAGFVASEVANSIVAEEKKLFKEFKYWGNSFTHGPESHRFMWHAIMRGIEEEIINLGTFALTDVLRESVKIWPTFFDFYEGKSFGSPYKLHSSLLLAKTELPTLSYFLRKTFINGLIKLAKYQPQESETTPEKILCIADWQTRGFGTIFQVPDINEHYKNRRYRIEIAKETEHGKVFYKNFLVCQPNQAETNKEITNENETGKEPETIPTYS